MLGSSYFAYPYLILLWFPIMGGLLWFMYRRRSRFEAAGRIGRIRERVYNNRRIIIIGHAFILFLICLALATPFRTVTRTVQSDPRVTILVDKSTSMDLYETGKVAELEAALAAQIPTTSVMITQGDRSAIGDGIFANLKGDDNLLLVSDGNNNAGSQLADVVGFAQSLNATINLLELPQRKPDALVRIDGPSEVIVESENDFLIQVKTLGEKQYTLHVFVDGNEVLTQKSTITQAFNLTQKLSTGSHRIEARIDIEDYFPQNNVVYKSVKVLPKPRILVMAREASPLTTLLAQVYFLNLEKALPQDLNSYHAVILDDVPGRVLGSSNVEMLNSFLLEGKGILVVGGLESFEHSQYRGSEFESLLPVKVGTGNKKDQSDERDINIVFVIDTSASQGYSFAKGQNTKAIDVGKANAINIINNLWGRDSVGAIAFNTIPFEISPLTRLEFKKDKLIEDISRLHEGGNTNIGLAIDAARDMLRGAKGSKNIILITDGADARMYYGGALEKGREAVSEGIRIYTVGLGAQTYSKDLREMAEVTGGYFYQPENLERFKILFGEPDEDELSGLQLEILNDYHFITQGLKLSGLISGYNQVLPKRTGQLLVSTGQGNPVLTVGRVGLGRIAVLSTDDGRKWAGELLSSKNSKLIARTINWLVGGSTEEGDLKVKIEDSYLGDRVPVILVANATPQLPGKEVEKVDQRVYQTYLEPNETGFHEYLSTTFAVNYPQEYAEIGISDQFSQYLRANGGGIFTPDQVDAIVEKVKMDSTKVVTDKAYIRWPFLLLALVVYLAEIAFRKIMEYRSPAGSEGRPFP